MECKGRREDAAPRAKVVDLLEENKGASHRGHGCHFIGFGAVVMHKCPLAVFTLSQGESFGTTDRACFFGWPHSRFRRFARFHLLFHLWHCHARYFWRRGWWVMLECRQCSSLALVGIPDENIEF